MGFWKTERGVGGDSWADEMGRCMKALDEMPVQERNSSGVEHHHITMQEFADLVEFCTRGHIVADVRFPEADSDRPLSQLYDNDVETHSNRGQIHCPAECGVGKEKE